MKRRTAVLLLVTTMAATVPAGETAPAGAEMSSARLEFMRSGTPFVGPILYVGDSLGVGTFPELRRLLPDVALDGDNRIGRSSGEGLRVLRSTLRRKHGVVIFDIGTNDRDTATMTRNLRRARKRAGDRLLVVFTLNKPGVAPLNGVLRDFARSADNVELVDWRAVAGKEKLLAGDGIHATAAGYRRRARLISAFVVANQRAPRVTDSRPAHPTKPATRRAASSRAQPLRPLVGIRSRTGFRPFKADLRRITAVAVCAGGAP